MLEIVKCKQKVEIGKDKEEKKDIKKGGGEEYGRNGGKT